MRCGEHEIMRDLIEGFVWCDLITVKVKSPHYAGFMSIHSDSYGQKIGLYFIKNTIYFLIHWAILWYNSVRMIIAQGLI